MKKYVGLALLLSSVAWAGFDSQGSQTPKVEWDSSGMPKCVQPARGESPGRGLLLRWTGDRFKREIHYALIEDARKTLLFGTDPSTFECSNWKTFERHWYRLHWKTLTPEDQVVGDYSFDPDTWARISQLRRGASVFHPEATGEEYLQAHPIPKFTRELNRELTSRYGVGFVAEIYKAWEEQRPENAAFKASILGNLDKAKAASLPALSARYADRLVLIANGIGNDPKDGRLAVLKADFLALGIPTEMLITDPYGTMDENAATLGRQIEAQLVAGKKLVILGTSKAIPELSAVLASLEPKLEGADNKPAGYGTIESVVTVSGLYDGCVLADWFDRQWGTPVFNWVVGALGKVMDKLNHQALEAYREMRTDRVRQFLSERQGRMPKSIDYVNLIGVIPGDGVAVDETILALQTYLLRPLIQEYGANDGYVEYPGTSMPSEWAPRIHRLVIDAGHPLTDGSFADEYSFTEEASRRQFFAGLFHSLADLRR